MGAGRDLNEISLNTEELPKSICYGGTSGHDVLKVLEVDSLKAKREPCPHIPHRATRGAGFRDHIFGIQNEVHHSKLAFAIRLKQPR